MPLVRVSTISEADLQDRLLRFDRPPYFGGKKKGIISAIGATVLAAGFTVVTLIACILGMIMLAGQGDIFGVAFLASAGTLLWVVFGFATACGVRGLYYYYRLPQDWRH